MSVDSFSSGRHNRSVAGATNAASRQPAASGTSAHASRHNQNLLHYLHSIVLRRSTPFILGPLSLPLILPSASHAGQPRSILPTLPGLPQPPPPPTDGGSGQPVALDPRVPPRKEPVVLTLASFAVTKLAYVRLTKKFREWYQASRGVDVRFRLTFAGSGVQARAVCDGLPADIVALALALDVQKIADSGLIDAGWKLRYPNNSVVCETTVAFVLRPGNPKNIKDWEDLIREDVQVVVANPKTAGVARWIFLALWGHKGLGKKRDEEARQFISAVFRNVVVQPRDAREASDVFYKQKVGDVLLTYENEVVLTNQIYQAKALPYIVPKKNIRIECPISLVDRVVETKTPTARLAADEFIRFLFAPEAQQEFADVGFRPNPKLSKYTAPHMVSASDIKMWNVDREIGGWHEAMQKFFNAGAILDQIQDEVGRYKLEQRKLATARK